MRRAAGPFVGVPVDPDSRDRANGKITYGQMGERLRIQESRDTSSSYGDYAAKALRQPG